MVRAVDRDDRLAVADIAGRARAISVGSARLFWRPASSFRSAVSALSARSGRTRPAAANNGGYQDVMRGN
jgi:hypothetical protein